MATLNDPLVRQLLEGRYIASLATHGRGGSIHMVSVWYWFHDGKIFVATASGSRKARNLEDNPAVSLMIDSRSVLASFGATISGTAKLVGGEASQNVNENIHQKYLSPAAMADPKVGAVFAAWDDVTIEITPRSVISWDLREADRQVFGGSLERNPSYLLPLEP